MNAIDAAANIGNSEGVSQGLGEIKKIIRHISLKVMRMNVRNKHEIKCNEVDIKDDFVYGHWMTFILVCGKDIQVTMGVHYLSKYGKMLAGTALKREVDLIKKHHLADFFREYCNLCAGEVKAILTGHGMPVGLSLPLNTRGTDEITFSDKRENIDACDWWKLDWEDGGYVTCFSSVDVLSPKKLIGIKAPSMEEFGEKKKKKISFL